MMRMMMKGTNVKMSSVVRRIVCTSRGRSVVPKTAFPKNLPDDTMSPPSILTPRAMNSAPSVSLPNDSSTVFLARSDMSSMLMLARPSSAMPSRALRSGISVASSVRSSSVTSSDAPRSTALTSLRSDASMTPNSATRSSSSSARNASDGASAASSSSCDKIRSISTCSVRTAKIRRTSLTLSSLSRISRAKRTRCSASLLEFLTTWSRDLDADSSALSLSCTSSESLRTANARSSAFDADSGKPSSAGSIPRALPSIPPFRRTHTPLV